MGDIVYLIFDPELQVVYGVGVVADRLQVTGGGSSLAGQGSQLNNLLTKLNERIALVVLEKNRYTLPFEIGEGKRRHCADVQ